MVSNFVGERDRLRDDHAIVNTFMRGKCNTYDANVRRSLFDKNCNRVLD